MKKLLILLIAIILCIFAFNKFQDYKRFNGPNVNYEISDKVDLNYHDKNILRNYYNAISQLNGFVNMQWSANRIDVVDPEKDDKQTQFAVEQFAEKRSEIKFYEDVLIQSKLLKGKGYTNADVKCFEKENLSYDEFVVFENKIKYRNIILKSYNDYKVKKGSINMLVFELQKMLNNKGFKIKIDGVFDNETADALKRFEEQRNLYPDGELDLLVLDSLLE